MNRAELSTTLEEAGLSPYQAEAYVTLLELGSASASEIASASSVPQPRIYDILRALADQGFVTVYERDHFYARVNDPSDALSSLRTTINRYESAIDEIEARYESPEISDSTVSLVQQFRTVLDHARDQIERADDHIQLAATPDQFTTLQPLLRAAYERGVHVQLSLFLPEDESLPFDESIFEGVCTDVRGRNLPGPFLLLVDRQRACYATHNRLSHDYGVLIDDYNTAYVFHWYYLTRLWEVYETLYSDRPTEPPYSYVEITDCIRSIEPLLQEGATITGCVDGEFTDTGRDCELDGQFIDIGYTASRPDDAGSLLKLAAEARVQFETEDGVYTVGGRGAFVEDIAGKRFTIENIDGTETSVQHP
ncbi:TrmB family transcriptional regulator sugar-binding domain-containing protein [Natrinema sp. LN54]|uniref:TrmB family transcriptional regulator sugar-binding domain-containing protein n=1 Tax=Natrinema sp. LN54 TaxID=3458705 RepID=UPI004034FECA